MSRQSLLDAIKGAGTEGNQPLFLRLYTENRIAYPVALEAYRSGVAWAKKVESLKIIRPDDTNRLPAIIT